MSSVGPVDHRQTGDVARAFAGAAVVAVTAAVALLGPVGALERTVFRVVNDLPDSLDPVLRAVETAGALYAVVVAVVLALCTRRRRLAIALAVSGTAAYLVAKLLKVLVDRGRPATELPDAIIRGEPASGMGFPSGHAAVAAALATALTPYLPRWARWVVWAVVLLVALARVYVGAHLPVDVIGGAAVGVTVGSLVNLALGRLQPQPDVAGEA